LTAPGRWRAVAGGTTALLLAGWIGLDQIGVPKWMPWTHPNESEAERTRSEAAARLDPATAVKPGSALGPAASGEDTRAPAGGPIKTPQIDGVVVRIFSVQRSSDRKLINLQYSVTTGSEYTRHDPASFVKLVAGGLAINPVWTSATARDVPPNSQVYI